ncbi:MAG: nucleotidyltransferase family protein [Anaerolineae bacterium]|nr:nucleotidyltransferase family protein [Anaerolineae bacterium]
MKTVAEIRQILQDQKAYLAERYDVAEISIFGSYVRGEQRADSDLDVLIELERPARISLIDLVELELYLSDLLGIKVDLAIKKNLKTRIGERILQEAIAL